MYILYKLSNLWYVTQNDGFLGTDEVLDKENIILKNKNNILYGIKFKCWNDFFTEPRE